MTERLDRLRQTLREFVAEREWEQFHDPKNLAMAVVSEAGELAAEYRWLRSDEVDEWSAQAGNRERVAAEAADVGIALLLFCERVGIDFLDAIERKIEVNRRNYPVDSSRGERERPQLDGQ
jgi:NTP pyrophosphatase (non-canonical NTP hydrolase)